MKRFNVFLSILFTWLIISGCSTVKVVTDVKSDADFSNYQTFKVVHFMNEEDQQAQKFRINPMT